MPQHHIIYNLPAEQAELDTAMSGDKWEEIVRDIRLFASTYSQEYIHREDLMKEINRIVKEYNL